MKLTTDIRRLNESGYFFTCYRDIEDGKYTLDLKPYHKDRTLNQNSLLWEIIRQIVIEESGKYVEKLGWNLYLKFIKEAGALTIDFQVKDSELDKLKRLNSFRAIIEIDYDFMTGMHLLRGYYGSSKMDTVEMSILLDVALDYASNLGIYTLGWVEELEKHNAG